MNRGDVLLVPFPFQDRPGDKIRPALVVQSNTQNQLLGNTVLAMITGNLTELGQPTTVLVDPATPEGSSSGLAGPSLLGQPTTVLVDPATPEGSSSGLAGPSLVKCCNLATIRQKRVLAIIGQLPPTLMLQVNLALKAALDLP